MGVANRGPSIRIPRHVSERGYGYMEDHRPASNADPYRVTDIIVETTLVDKYIIFVEPVPLKLCAGYM
ncbi:hypothetical protein BGY98DRAFT_1093403 [Russula aff. rugulosa BPL654]|nr:hypothetical protein BGY98DRAFT_1093403 [Russula aff. rugulosa BPL654]